MTNSKQAFKQLVTRQTHALRFLTEHVQTMSEEKSFMDIKNTDDTEEVRRVKNFKRLK